MVGARPFERSLILKSNTLRIELLAIIEVVDAQIKVLRDMNQFQLDSSMEQFKVMHRAIEAIIVGRESFRGEVETILGDLQASQQLVYTSPPLSRER